MSYYAAAIAITFDGTKLGFAEKKMVITVTYGMARGGSRVRHGVRVLFVGGIPFHDQGRKVHRSFPLEA